DTISTRFIEEYFKDAHGLGVHDADVHPLATENIPQILSLVQTLIEKGFAYAVENGDVYFRTEKFKSYGKLSHQPLEDLKAGARITVNDIKESPMDFALWKGAKPGEPSWESPWGAGRPGWHIECSAMANRYLGKTIDIHCGGEDLMFPHHENEIAQSEAANGRPFVHYWLHNAFLNIDNTKMSKSLGNFFTVREAADTYGYEPIRFFMLSAHYRSPINYSRESLTQAQAALERLYTAVDNLDFLVENGEDRTLDKWETELIASFDQYRARFIEAMDDDFNTADAIGVLFELVRAVNTAMTAHTPSRQAAKASLDMIQELTNVLGLLYRKEEKSLDAAIEEMIEKRQAARKAKDFKTADAIRDQLKEMGILLEDTPQGVKWKKA
ncbi:MAG: cysteine--tRNA ligase, partial [Oscillospiraceae bacterium]|nr:cysteine--tRNA ligase [Oscillospiraceae bacterium]